MTTASVVLGGKAKKAAREHAESTPQPLRLVKRVLEVSQRIVQWQRSPQKELAKAAGVSPRSVEYWNDGGGLSSEALANLIRSEEGFRFLEAIMDGAQPRWWRICRPMMEIMEMRARAQAQQKRVRQVVQGALDEEFELSAAISRAETAMGFQDEEFYRPHLDAQRAMAGVPPRSLARSGKGQAR